MVREYIPANKRKKVAEKFLSAFEMEDADDFDPDDDLLIDADRKEE